MAHQFQMTIDQNTGKIKKERIRCRMSFDSSSLIGCIAHTDDNNQSESCFQTSLCSYSCSFCSYQYSRYIGVQGTSYDGKSTAQQHLLGHTDVDHTHMQCDDQYQKPNTNTNTNTLDELLTIPIPIPILGKVS